ncbi:MAG: hypothetical protein O3A01_02955 [bacterium]|nr:hypothetical protein [bacterium]
MSKINWNDIKENLKNIKEKIDDISKLRIDRTAHYKKIVAQVENQIVVNNARIQLYKQANTVDPNANSTLRLGFEVMADAIDIHNNKFMALEQHLEELYYTVDSQRECISLLKKSVVDMAKVVSDGQNRSVL